MSRSRRRQRDADGLTALDVGRLVGLVLILVCFLLLASVPQSGFRWWKRDGYRTAQVQVLVSSGRRTRMPVRVTATGEELSVNRSSFDDPAPGAVLPVWYNPDATLTLMLRVFDERVVSAQRHVLPASGAEALGGIVAMLAAGAVGAHLVLRREPRKIRRV